MIIRPGTYSRKSQVGAQVIMHTSDVITHMFCTENCFSVNHEHSIFGFSNAYNVSTNIDSC